MPDHSYRMDLMGHAKLADTSPIVAGSWTNFTLIYTAGKFGIDDLGSVRVAMRTHSDMTPLQTTDPKAPGYLTVEASNGAPLEYRFDYKRNIRPWGNCITVLCKGFLRPNDTLTFRIGDSRQGCPGVRMQTHCESAFQFRVTVDAFASVDYTPVLEEHQPTVTIIPGPPVVWKALLPTLRRPGEPFRLIIKAEDRWGNPSDQFDGSLRLKAKPQIDGLPSSVTLARGQFSTIVDELTLDVQGDYTVEVFDGDTLHATSNPLRIADSPFAHFWSDMHGQSGESIGTGTAREYFAFARDRSFIDITGHQANDFQVTDAFWDEINALAVEFNVEGKFLCLPGYEWSGNTGLGGDHNIWYRTEGRPIYRSSRALISDETRPETDCHDVKDLFDALLDEDVIVVPHVGGRFADVSYAHDARLEPSVEVHSSWGTFDWIVEQSLQNGHRIGIVAGSDGHKGRPGASYPGDAKFGSYGGLTCHLLPNLSRDALFEEFRRRHHYATTGVRLFLSTSLSFEEPARIFHRNPDFEPKSFVHHSKAIMGDIVRTQTDTARLDIEVSAPSPVERVDLFDGTTLLETIRPFTDADLGARLRIICKGQETWGRGRLVKWTGQARLSGANASRIAAVNYYNPDKQPKLTAPGIIDWVTVTTGGFSAIDVWLSRVDTNAKIEIETNLGTLKLAMSDIGVTPTVLECGGIDKTLSVQRLPEVFSDKRITVSRDIAIPKTGERAVFARVALEDGHIAWSSPIYVGRDTA
ncbi:hypothetical protein OA238_c12420 [Octadecabacter arcticus 238]|uniref:DUF3604 domain-containing protein n=1 Tax=Octadecabacter arcticus 238 TaxID=391616 RepID=M9RGV4_9RHOB|nr:DUF3604 domain-containing protein [Octadecabacter arcticus]AGI71412.1 hypothetical protein OA238_c12420 [Octadecabacter arcticus 238]